MCKKALNATLTFNPCNAYTNKPMATNNHNNHFAYSPICFHFFHLFSSPIYSSQLHVHPIRSNATMDRALTVLDVTVFSTVSTHPMNRVALAHHTNSVAIMAIVYRNTHDAITSLTARTVLMNSIAVRDK